MFKKILPELFEAPLELFYRGDEFIKDKFRPLTKKLDEINPRLKYIPNYLNFAYLVNIPFSQLPINCPIGLSSLSYLGNIGPSMYHFISGKHTGYIETDDGRKKIHQPLVIPLNKLAKKTRFISILEGSFQIALGTYQLLSENENSEFTFFLIQNGIIALEHGLTTYLYQANDDEPRSKNKMFSKTRKSLEKILSPNLNPEPDLG